MSALFLSFYFFIVLVLSVFGLHRYYMTYVYYRARDKGPEGCPFEELPYVPVVTVQLPIYNERYVVPRLIRSVCELDYPRNKLHIQVLDDSTDDTVSIVAQEVASYAKQGFQIECIHRKNREGYKAGALNEGLKAARGEFVAVFDADFLPQKDFLKKMIIHFFKAPLPREDPDFGELSRAALPVRTGREGVRGRPVGVPRSKVGMVQARWGHLNRDYSLLTQAQSILLDGHFIIEHTARNRTGCFFNFNGTAGIWRKSCVDDAGGWSGDTLTEDIDLSYRAQMAGWNFVYLRDVVCPAELPVDINALKSQQHRWAKGSVQVAKKLLPQILKGPYPFRVKMEAFFHLASNFTYLLMVLLSFLIPLSLYVRHGQGWGNILLIDLPLFLSATWSISVFYYHSQKEIHRDLFARLKYIPFSLSLGIGLCVNNAKAVVEGLFNQRGEFTRTPKYAVLKKGDSWKEKQYRGNLNVVSIVELFLTVYFSLAIVYLLKEGLYLSLPFILLFQIGFLYTAILSLLQSRSFSKLTPLLSP